MVGPPFGAVSDFATFGRIIERSINLTDESDGGAFYGFRIIRIFAIRRTSQLGGVPIRHYMKGSDLIKFLYRVFWPSRTGNSAPGAFPEYGRPTAADSSDCFDDTSDPSEGVSPSESGSI